jgi:hypothetical protein
MALNQRRTMEMSGSERKKRKMSRKAMEAICGRGRELLRGFTDEKLAWIMFHIDNPHPTEREMEEATESIKGSRLVNRELILDKLSDAAFDFGITDEPPQELGKSKETVRDFFLERGV